MKIGSIFEEFSRSALITFLRRGQIIIQIVFSRQTVIYHFYIWVLGSLQAEDRNTQGGNVSSVQEFKER